MIKPGAIFIKLLKTISYLGENFKSRFLYFYPYYFIVFHKHEKFHKKIIEKKSEICI